VIASFVASWLVLTMIAALGALAMAVLYLREAHGERRPSKLTYYRRRVVPLASLASIAALRAFVFKG
jgi:hypothetical protein